MQDDIVPTVLPTVRLFLLLQTLVAFARQTGIQDIYLLVAALLAALLVISVLITLLVWLRIFVIAALVSVIMAVGLRWGNKNGNGAHHGEDDPGHEDEANREAIKEDGPQKTVENEAKIPEERITSLQNASNLVTPEDMGQ